MKNNLISLWKHIPFRRRFQFSILFALMVLASFAEVVSIAAVMPFLTVITSPESLYSNEAFSPLIRMLNISEPQQLLLPLTIVFSVAALFSGAMRLVLLWTQTRLSHAIGADISFSIYRRTLYQPYAIHVARNSSEVIAGVSQKANEVVHLVILPLLIIFSSAVMLIAILAVLLTIETMVALTTFTGFAMIYLIIIALTKRKVQRNSEIISGKQNQVIKALQEGLGGIRDVLIDGTQSTYCQTYRDADLPLRRARADIQIISSAPRFAIESFGMVLIAFLAYSLSRDGSDLANTVPILGALALGAQRLLPTLQQAYSNWTLIRGGQSQLRDALILLDQPLPDFNIDTSIKAISFQDTIEFKHVSFSYSEKTPLVLKDISLTIKKGTRIGIVGTTGSGKSTFIDIVMGLLQPTKGCLKIDGTTINAENMRSWQLNIAHVPQAIFLADATIAENIALGTALEKIDIARMEDAAKKAQIYDTIESLELKYKTKVGERGVRLSGGQRQRIGIARALYKQADVIIFDEATSALDDVTETAVMKAIDNIRNEVTMIIVAHRKSTLSVCDQVIQLSNGTIRKVGSYEEIVGAIPQTEF